MGAIVGFAGYGRVAVAGPGPVVMANVGQYLANPDYVHGLRIYSHCLGTVVHEKPQAFQHLNFPRVLQLFASHP